MQSEERRNEKEGQRLYLSNACVATLRVAVRAFEYLLYYATKNYHGIKVR